MNSQQPPIPPLPGEYKKYEDEIRRYQANHPAQPEDIPVSARAAEAVKQIPPEQAYKNASGNFYAIAGFSFINSLISVFGGGLVFVIGLGITQLVDAIAYMLDENAGGSSFIFTVAALVFDLGAALTFALFGYFTSRGRNWALITGMILYGLDTILMLLFRDWIGLAFHVYFLWQIWMMARVLAFWKKLDKKQVDSFPQDIGVS